MGKGKVHRFKNTKVEINWPDLDKPLKNYDDGGGAEDGNATVTIGES